MPGLHDHSQAKLRQAIMQHPQVAGPPPTTLSATPTAGSCGLHVSWAAFELLEMLGLLVPSRCGPALFLGTIDGAGGEDVAMKQEGGPQPGRESHEKAHEFLGPRIGGSAVESNRW